MIYAVTLTDELGGSIPPQATNARIAQLVERQPSKLRVTSSSLVSRSNRNNGLVVQMVRISACHAEDHEFESRPDRLKLNNMRKMTSYLATGLAEGFEEGTEKEIITAWQYLHDTGLAYKLQGWFGRTARDLIEQGIIKE